MPRFRATGRGSGKDRDGVSEFTTERLSVYLRCLTILEAAGVRTISSARLAERFHLNSAQIRKDLACFGELGVRGVGYEVAALRRHITTTLGLDRMRRMVIVGAGNLGLALSDYPGFNSNGFVVTAVFDNDPKKTGGRTRGGIPIMPDSELPRFAPGAGIEVGVIAVPAAAAQNVYDVLADSGVRAVLNFAPVQLDQRPDIRTRSVDLRINLESLSFALANESE